ncbi:hypothetical protein ES703_62574 [subsurface metagenome]
MAKLKNNRHEIVARERFKGKSLQEAMETAGYSPKWARSAGSRLLSTNANILDRIVELHQKADSDAIMSVRERKEKLTEIGRGNIPDFITEEGIKVNKDSPHVGAVSEITSVTRVFRKSGEPVVITKLKLHPPITAIAELNKMGGDYPPPNVLKLEVDPGEKWEPMLANLLARLRGYGNKDKD